MNANTSFFYRAIAIVALAQTATPLLGCDDSEPPVVPVAPRAGSGGSAGSAGQGGRGGSGGSGGARAGAPAPKPVTCGSVTCQLSTVRIPMLTPLAPCCVAPAEGTCGWMNMAGMCVPPPAVDPDCPPSDMGQKGCCIAATNRCGIDATMFGADCFELAGSAFANPANPARTCDGVVVEEDDAGVDDDSDGGVDGGPSAGSGGAGGTAGSSGAGGSGGSGGGSASGGSGGSGGRGTRGLGGRGGLPFPGRG